MKINLLKLVAPLCALLILSILQSCSDDDDNIITLDQPSLGVTSITTNVDDTSAAINLESITINRLGISEEFEIGELLNVEVLSYVSTAKSFEVTLLGTPNPADITPVSPIVGTRAEMLEDNAVNSNLNNPSEDVGLDFQFVTSSGAASPLINGPGPDLVMFELGPPPGAPVPGGFQSVGGDPFQISGIGNASTNTLIINDPEAYNQIGDDGAAANMTFYTNVEVDPMTGPSPAEPILSLEALENTDLNLLATTGLNVYVIAIDLSDLGFEEGDSVSQLNLRSNGVMFGVDPSLILGLPTLDIP